MNYMKLARLAVILVFFGSLGFVFYASSKEGPTDTSARLDEIVTDAPIATTVRYSKSGFDQQTITIRKDQAVRFVNDSKVALRVASDPHPYHTDLPKFDAFTGIKEGESYAYTFDKVGTWKYHNHSAPSHEATVIVEE